jgi:Spy/CpxP family protein refolding chaperone
MTVKASRRTILFLAMAALGATALGAPAIRAASLPRVATGRMAEPHTQAQPMDGTSARRAFRPQPQDHMDDPFSSMLLG